MLARAAPSQPPPCRATIIAEGRDVVRREAAALAGLAGVIDDRFADAVTVTLSAHGRVIVSGMGKSGHVARKVAATLASTGTPALFVHPAEAAHGDLGMVVPGDVLVLLSNSGATAELLPLARHAKTIGVAVVAICARPATPLMALADVRLCLPAIDEAGPEQLAPTTSTAMMMALGDALAMAAMRVRGWSRAEFAALHPGGAIGSRLGEVGGLMHGPEHLPLVAPETAMRDVIVTMTSRSFGIAGVVDPDGALVGVITDGDLRRHADELFGARAHQVMSTTPVTTAADASAETVLALMHRHAITALFVTAGPRPVGLVHVHDFLRAGLS